jgi:propionyl-CoA carboxylase alpha chain
MVWPAEAAALLDIMPVKVPVDTSRVILSPMPGVVKMVSVSVGDTVGEGQECAVVEAMKMQNSLASGVTGVVKVEELYFSFFFTDLWFKDIHYKQGDTVDEEQVMMEIE